MYNSGNVSVSQMGNTEVCTAAEFLKGQEKMNDRKYQPLENRGLKRKLSQRWNSFFLLSSGRLDSRWECGRALCEPLWGRCGISGGVNYTVMQQLSHHTYTHTHTHTHSQTSTHACKHILIQCYIQEHTCIISAKKSTCNRAFHACSDPFWCPHFFKMCVCVCASVTINRHKEACGVGCVLRRRLIILLSVFLTKPAVQIHHHTTNHNRKYWNETSIITDGASPLYSGHSNSFHQDTQYVWYHVAGLQMWSQRGVRCWLSATCDDNRYPNLPLAVLFLGSTSHPAPVKCVMYK